MFQLSRLISFNQALVYGFDPEASEAALKGSTKIEDNLYITVGQYMDMLEGYLYAQEHILPSIKHIGIQKISPAMLLDWISKLHGFFGGTLINSMESPSKAGEYNKTTILRWKHSSLISIYLEDALSTFQDYKFKCEEMRNHFVTELKMDPLIADQFIKLINNIREKTLKAFKGTSEEDLQQLVPHLVIEHIIHGYRGKNFSEQEMKVIDAIMIIGMPIDAIPKRMHDYVESTLIEWKACNKKDLRAVSQFLAESFFQLTEIHPFPNANGRTATGLINIMLRSFDLPSILLRLPGERRDSSSLYCKALDCINDSRELLAEHIYNRIQEAQRQPFQHPRMAKQIELRVNHALHHQAIRKKYPTFNFDFFDAEMNAACVFGEHHFANNEIETSIFILSHITDIWRKAEVVLDQKGVPTSSTVGAHPSFFLSPPPTDPTQLYSLAIANYKDQHYMLAFERFNQAIKLFSAQPTINAIKIARCYSSLASCQRDMGLTLMALISCDSAMKFTKDDADLILKVRTKKQSINELLLMSINELKPPSEQSSSTRTIFL